MIFLCHSFNECLPFTKFQKTAFITSGEIWKNMGLCLYIFEFQSNSKLCRLIVQSCCCILTYLVFTVLQENPPKILQGFLDFPMLQLVRMFLYNKHSLSSVFLLFLYLFKKWPSGLLVYERVTGIAKIHNRQSLVKTLYKLQVNKFLIYW